MPFSPARHLFDFSDVPAVNDTAWRVAPPDDDLMPGASFVTPPADPENGFEGDDSSPLLTLEFELPYPGIVHFQARRRGELYSSLRWSIGTNGAGGEVIGGSQSDTGWVTRTYMYPAGVNRLEFHHSYSNSYTGHSTYEDSHVAGIIYQPLYGEPVPKSTGGFMPFYRTPGTTAVFLNSRPKASHGRIIGSERDIINGGLGYIEGVVYAEDRTPIQREVAILERQSLRLVARTLSETNSGRYRFDYLNEKLEYMLVGLDHLGEVNAVIEDRVRPEPMGPFPFGRGD